MDSEVGAAVEQRLLELLSEKAFGADLRQRDIRDFVAGSLDDFDAGCLSMRGQPVLDPIRLPEGELRTARCDNKHV